MKRLTKMALLGWTLTMSAGWFIPQSFANEGSGDVKTQTIVYRDGGVTLEGYAAWPAKASTAQGPGVQCPGVLVVHQWMGLTDYEQRRCRELAGLGYVAFALDIYGQGVRPADTGEAARLAGKYKTDRSLYRQRLLAGLAQLRGLYGVATQQIAAIGYCFGGTGAIELARSGADIEGVVSFHGGLDSPSPDDGQQIQAKVLIAHGADDPFVPEADIKACLAEFDAADVDWQMDIYSGAVHSFTQPMAGDDNSKGAAYNAAADRRSWNAMRLFFDELFASR